MSLTVGTRKHHDILGGVYLPGLTNCKVRCGKDDVTLPSNIRLGLGQDTRLVAAMTSRVDVRWCHVSRLYEYELLLQYIHEDCHTVQNGPYSMRRDTASQVSAPNTAGWGSSAEGLG